MGEFCIGLILLGTYVVSAFRNREVSVFQFFLIFYFMEFHSGPNVVSAIW